jgi:elongation factor P
MDIGDIHSNTKILIDGTPYNVDEVDFVKPGKGRAIYRLKLRNLITGNPTDRTFHSGEKVEEVNTTNYEEQYLYKEGGHYVFMNTQTFEQHLITGEQLGSKKAFLKDGIMVTTMMMGDQILGVTLPNFVELAVVESTAATKTGTVTPQSKSATMETGCVIEVPGFVKDGDIIKVDTRTGTYVERVGTKK